MSWRQHLPTASGTPLSRQIIMIGAVAIPMIIIGMGSASLWHRLSSQPTSDPFSAKVISSLSFGLYYPKHLPAGYTLDRSSITEPQTGVVVITLKNSNGEKIYMSEEQRPTSFDFGGYYGNFTDLQEKTIGSGTIAVGYINNGQTLVGSFALNNTWVLLNTSARLPSSQFTQMLSSLAAGP